MIIRKAKKEDAKELNWLLTLLIRDEKQYDDSINEEFVVTNMYENYIEDTNRYIIVAEDNNKIVGYLYGYLKDNDITVTKKSSLIDALFITLEYRHKGIANQLINEFKNWSKNNNVDTIEIGVCSQNIKARNLYLKHRFKPLKETLIYSFNEEEEELDSEIDKARNFCMEVRELASKYNLPFFVVTDKASAISNNGCEAVKNARDNHIKWEKERNFDPDEDWSK